MKEADRTALTGAVNTLIKTVSQRDGFGKTGMVFDYLVIQDEALKNALVNDLNAKIKDQKQALLDIIKDIE